MIKTFVLDRALILGRLGGDEEIFAMMLDLYLQDVEANCAAIAAALASGDPGELQRAAHTLKGLLATFSDEAGADVALHLELKAKAGEIVGLDAAVAALQSRLRQVAGVLQAEVSRVG